MQKISLRDTLDQITPIDQAALVAAQSRMNRQTKPQGSLGRLEEFAKRFVAISGQDQVRKKVVVTFAADHGVAEEGVSAFPREVTAQMVYNFLNGGAAINALARHAGAEVIVVDMGVDHDFATAGGLLQKKIARGTGNFCKGAAMSRQQAIQALETGIEIALSCKEAGIGLIGTGDMGIANTTASAAIASVLTGLDVEQVTHRGTGIDDATLNRKLRVIEKGLMFNQPNPKDPVDVLAKVGGFEIGGIAGLILGCALVKIPVVIDGFISTAGALIAAELHCHVNDYLFAAHQSVEIGHTHMLQRIGLQPIFDFGMRLGEGTGAALAMGVIEASLQAYREIATFEDAGVSEQVS
jgi:nicotinate-nucleotide--dimethylbenzimidazole phosphoribosyltransferase